MTPPTTPIFDSHQVTPTHSVASENQPLSITSIREGKGFVRKQGQPHPHVHSTVEWPFGMPVLFCNLFGNAETPLSPKTCTVEIS